MPPQDPPKLLKNRQPFPVQGQYGIAGLIVGLGVMFAGCGIFLAITKNPQGAHAPHAVIWAVGLVFSIAGLFVAYQGAQDVIRRRRLKQWMTTKPQEPWTWDHSWDPTGSNSGLLKGIIRTLNIGAFLFLFLVPFNWWAYVSGAGPVVMKIIVGLFDGIVLMAMFVSFKDLQRYLRYGQHRLEFDQFPYSLGRRLSVRLQKPETLLSCTTFTATLRCIQQIHGSSSTSSKSIPQVQAMEIFEDHRIISPQLPIQFDLPQGDYANRLLESEPRYWELEVSGNGPRGQYSETYLLPIYATSQKPEELRQVGSALEAIKTAERTLVDQVWSFVAVAGLMFGLFLTAILLFDGYRAKKVIRTWPVASAEVVSVKMDSRWSTSGGSGRHRASQTLQYFPIWTFRIYPTGQLATKKPSFTTNSLSYAKKQAAAYQVGRTYSIRQNPQNATDISLIITLRDFLRSMSIPIYGALIAWGIYGFAVVRERRRRNNQVP